jgi:hypothetical protein
MCVQFPIQISFGTVAQLKCYLKTRNSYYGYTGNVGDNEKYLQNEYVVTLKGLDTRLELGLSGWSVRPCLGESPVDILNFLNSAFNCKLN